MGLKSNQPSNLQRFTRITSPARKLRQVASHQRVSGQIPVTTTPAATIAQHPMVTGK